LTDLGWVCSCPDHKYRDVKCKHIFAVEISFALHKEVEATLIEPVDTDFCVYCKSVWIVKDGLRHNKYVDIQKFNCKDCGRYFIINQGFERIHATPEMVTSAMQLYFTSESLRNIQKFLKLQGVKISHIAIYNWIRKYVGLMKTYLEKITPNVADAWRAKRLKSVYGDDFKFLAPQEQFVSDHFWNRAIPTEQEIKEIEIEKDTLDKPDTVQVIRDRLEWLD
jgi:putative transposase